MSSVAINTVFGFEVRHAMRSDPVMSLRLSSDINRTLPGVLAVSAAIVRNISQSLMSCPDQLAT